MCSSDLKTADKAVLSICKTSPDLCYHPELPRSMSFDHKQKRNISFFPVLSFLHIDNTALSAVFSALFLIIYRTSFVSAFLSFLITKVRRSF